MYQTLTEAAQWLSRRLGGPERIGEEVTEGKLLHAGIAGHLLICVPLDSRCYSPTLGTEADAFGLFVVPPRHLFALEVQPSVRLQMVHSLDGKQIFFPFEDVRRDMLRVHDEHLRDFAARIKLPANKQGGTEPKLTPEKKIEVKRRLKRGESVTSLARAFGVSRRTIDKCKPAAESTALATAWSSTKVKRHLIR